MRVRLLPTIMVLLSAVLTQGCSTARRAGEKWDEISQPSLPREIHAHTTTYTRANFSPWKPPNPFDYEGEYFGEYGDTGEYLEIEIFGEDEGIQITGTKRTETAGRAPVTTPIPPTDFNLEYDPFFRALRANGFFVIFTDPKGDLFPEPVRGIVHGDLFYAKKDPPPSESEEEEYDPRYPGSVRSR